MFDVAERELDIPALLDPQDMAECSSPDRLSILTYLAEFYHKFKTVDLGKQIIHRKKHVAKKRDKNQEKSDPT